MNAKDARLFAITNLRILHAKELTEINSLVDEAVRNGKLSITIDKKKVKNILPILRFEGFREGLEIYPGRIQITWEN